MRTAKPLEMERLSEIHTERFTRRFWGRVDVAGPDECWEWTGWRNPKGYGIISILNKSFRAHRIALAMDGRPPGQMNALHSCDNPPCVNPAHLYPGTDSENMKDAYDRNCKTPLRGEMHGSAILTERDVKAIRRRLDEGAAQSHVAGEFGVSPSTIKDIVSGRIWSHV